MSHHGIYEAPFVYDLAFSYRDFDRERAFLTRAYEHRRGRAPSSFLEVAAGPARHALAFAAAGTPSRALDLSPAMVAYGRELAAERNLDLRYEVGDMRSFALGERVDLAACMIASGSYLLTDADLGAHLDAVAGALAPDGIYVMELSHPSEIEGPPKTINEWEVRDRRGVVEVEWAEGPIDADTHVRECVARMRFTPSDGTPGVERRDTAMQRVLTVHDLERASATCARLALDAVFGALDESIPIDHDKAWRLVAVFART